MLDPEKSRFIFENIFLNILWAGRMIIDIILQKAFSMNATKIILASSDSRHGMGLNVEYISALYEVIEL